MISYDDVKATSCGKGSPYLHKAGGGEKIAANNRFNFLIKKKKVVFNPLSLIRVLFCLFVVCFYFQDLLSRWRSPQSPNQDN